MRYIDLHCDTLTSLFMHSRSHPDLYDAPYASVDLRRLRQAGAMAQFFAVFLPNPGFFSSELIDVLSDEDYFEELAGYLSDNLRAHPQVAAFARNAQDLIEHAASDKTSAFLTIEDGRLIDGKFDHLDRFYALGVRILTLTWNFPNCFGSPNSDDPLVMQEGLTRFGKEAIAQMESLGMLIDVSHLSDGGFYDVARIAQKPFAATHSNSRTLAPHRRNLTDEMVKLLGEKGGVAGLNFCPAFLNTDPQDLHSTAGRIAQHARHLAHCGGIECVALGGDLDGISGDLEIGDPTQMPLLEKALRAEGFSEADLERIFYKNALRIIQDVLK